MRRVPVVTVFFAVVLATPAVAQTALEDPIEDPIEVRGAPVSWAPVADGMTAPNWGAAPPGRAHELWVVDQPGILWALDLEEGGKDVVLDVSDRLVSLGVAGPGTFDERGFLGLAFRPDFADSGLLYTYTSEPVDGPADFSTMPPGASPDHQSVISEWQVAAPQASDAVVDPGATRVAAHRPTAVQTTTPEHLCWAPMVTCTSPSVMVALPTTRGSAMSRRQRPGPEQRAGHDPADRPGR